MSQKARILYISHCYNNRGGVEEHVKALEKGLKPHYEVSVVYPENGMLYLKTSDGVQEFPSDIPKWPITPYHLPQMEKSLDEILALSKPDVIHIQHFLNWHLGMIDQVLAFGRKTALSFHEYYAITPHFTMEGVERVRDVLTEEYSLKIFGTDIREYLQQRKEILINSFSKIDLQIVPSQFLALELAKAFPREYRVVPHGIDPFDVPNTAPKTSATHFVYLGSLIPQKGWESLVEGFSLARETVPKIELHLHGGGEAGAFAERENVFFHPAYSPSDLPEILSKADVGVIPSVFRETFSYVLSEMWQARLPVLASDIGALGERIRSEGGGSLFQAGNPHAIAQAILDVSNHPQWLGQTIPTPRTVDKMLEEYQTLYQGLLNE